MPVWSPDGTAKRDLPTIAEREGVRVIAGVGGGDEWWVFNAGARVGHLRVGLTAAEYALIPAGWRSATQATRGRAAPAPTRDLVKSAGLVARQTWLGKLLRRALECPPQPSRYATRVQR